MKQCHYLLLIKQITYVHPTGGGHIIFFYPGIRRPLSHLVSGHFKEKYLSYLYQI